VPHAGGPPAPSPRRGIEGCQAFPGRARFLAAASAAARFSESQTQAETEDSLVNSLPARIQDTGDFAEACRADIPGRVAEVRGIEGIEKFRAGLLINPFPEPKLRKPLSADRKFVDARWQRGEGVGAQPAGRRRPLPARTSVRHVRGRVRDGRTRRAFTLPTGLP
jgi:hypothetical protein